MSNLDAQPVKPISLTWREWLKAHAPKPGPCDGPAFDALVVGSGYGGSVAALRLVEKGYRVLLLERGSEYLAGEFPSDVAQVPKFFRGNVPGAGAPVGRATGLVEFHVGQGIVAVTGNGLGGGSLVNAGVTIRPDDDVFSQPPWPAEIRCGDVNDVAPSLRAAFDQAEQTLQAVPWRSGRPGGADLLKTAALRRLAADWKAGDAAFQTPRLTVDPDHCIRCGDCAAGCNVPHAKRSLDHTYLRQAYASGRLQIVTQAEVYRFEPLGAWGWSVMVFSTDEQGQKLGTREVLADPSPRSTVRRLHAPLLFICAGTYGSTQLLQRSQALGKDLLAFSSTLGQRLSANGDSLSVSVNEATRVNSVGLGAGAVGAYAARSEDMVGPTITGMIDLRDRQAPLPARLLVEEGAIPRAISQMYRELLSTVWTLNQLERWWYRAPQPAQDGLPEDPLGASAGLAGHTQVLLTMGHDGSPGRLVWMAGDDCTAGYVPDPAAIEGYKFQQHQFDKTPDRRHMHSPLWQALPPSATALMSGAQPPQSITTVHPLGGCVMSDHPAKGVVNHLGQVWVGDPGRWGPHAPAMCPPADEDPVAEPRVYKGLYVLDGSIIPTSLGCNPFLTITALAERAMAAIPANTAMARDVFVAQTSPDRHPVARPSEEVALDVVLAETLTARNVAVRGPLAAALGETQADSRFEAKFTAEDFPKVLRGSGHRMKVQATLDFGAPGQAGSMRYGTANAPETEFSFLLPNGFSTGPRRLLALGALALLALVSVLAPHFLRPWQFWLVLAVVLVFCYPLVSTVLTWLVLRYLRDRTDAYAKAIRTPASMGLPQRVIRWVKEIVSGFKQMLHASEERWMHYRVPLVRETGHGPENITLFATKRVGYFARPAEWWCWMAARLGGGEPTRLRPTYWEQIMNADVRVVAGYPETALGGTVLARGQWCMGFDNLLEQGRALQMGRSGDAVSGLTALAGYPLLFIRFAIKTRLLDLRLPEYSRKPVADNAGADEPAGLLDREREVTLRLPGGGVVEPQRLWIKVARGRSRNDTGVEPQADLRLQLWRYRRPGGAHPETASQATWMGHAVTRAKSVLLLHAFGQSGLTYTFKQTSKNLAEAFYDAGYEVWVLDSRMSTRSGYADEPFTVDMMAENDIPKAVETICDTLSRELQPTAATALPPVQISVFAQCIGAASVWMALLGGRLSHGRAAMGAEGSPDAPQMSRISHLMCSQVHPWIVGSRLTQAKTWVPALVNSLTGGAAIPFAVRGEQGMVMQLVDRVLASMPAPTQEDRKAAHSGGGTQPYDDAGATFRRIRFIEAPLVRHDNLNPATFQAINRLFGEANIRLFMHARRFVEKGRLVDEDGLDCYVTDANIRKHLAFPIQLMHGERNELFDPRSATHSFEQLQRVQGAWQTLAGLQGPLMFADYAHLDGLIGCKADKEVYPGIVGFFDQAFQIADHQVCSTEVLQRVLRPPRVGPFLGWVRSAGADGEGRAILRARVSLVVDNADGSFAVASGGAPGIVVRRWNPSTRRYMSLNQGLSFRCWRRTSAAAQSMVAVWGDVEWTVPYPAGERFQFLTVHPTSRLAAGEPGLPDAATDAEIDAWIARHAALPQALCAPPREAVLLAQDFDQAVVHLNPAAWQGVIGASDSTCFAASCCRYPGLGLDRYRVDDSVRQLLACDATSLNFCLLVGDQIYADATAGLVDSRSPSERYFDRHEDAFGRDRRAGPFAGDIEEPMVLHRLLSSVPTYMTPDDHEWVNNYPSAQALVMESWMAQPWNHGHQTREQLAWETANDAVTAFQRLQSPLGDSPRQQQGAYAFDQGCVRVFVIDTRMDRDGVAGLVVTPAVLQHLQAWLAQPEAQDHLNVVVSGTVALPNFMADTDPANPGADDNWCFSPQQRQALFDMLVGSQRRFVLLSGDYHLSCMLALQVRCDGAADVQTVGAAIVTPPLYAPLPMVNASPDFLDLGAVIHAAGAALSMATAEGGEPCVGSGYAVIEVERQGEGFMLRCRRTVRDLQAGGAWQAPLVGTLLIP